MLMFQSLTGSIHTSSCGIFSLSIILVSIPHRFNSHGTFGRKSLRSLTGFNPSQVQFTLFFIDKLRLGYFAFQSLTGSIHTEKDEHLKVYLFVVSIPHRFNSHVYCEVEDFTQENCFNPSQVQFTQFLIDEIKFNEVYVSIPHRFNSHNEGQDFGCVIGSFQSLTGSIHTVLW